MNEAITNIIYQKLSDGFRTKFIPRRKFDSEFLVQQNSLIESLTFLIKRYFELKNSENSEIIKITKTDYIIRQFNNRNYNNAEYTIDNIVELKLKFDSYFNNYEEQYNRNIDNNDEDFIVSLTNYLVDKTTEFISTKDKQDEFSIKYLFWDYFHNTYINKSWYYSKAQEKEIVKSPELIVKKFQDYYLSNIYIRLLDIAEKNLADESISPFDKVVINVGKRHYDYGRAGWSTTRFQIFNNDKEYNFSYSAKDEKEIQGECINIFIFQTKYLIKISITLEEVERTPYIIHRDCEKVSLKNDCELVIVKHHGNETIVFDTRKDAMAMQTKLIEIREGRNRK